MKHTVLLALSAFFACSPLLSQTPSSTASSRQQNGMPSIDDMISSISGGVKDFSLADSIQDMMTSMGSDTLTENTEDTVRSAVEGPLVVEETVPEVNKELVEAIDTKTKRYSPRLRIDFTEFPLQRLSSGVSGPNVSGSSNDIQRRLRARLRSEDIKVDFNGRTARLFGAVESARQREIAEIMLRLEPGVDVVKNELRLRD